MAVLEEHILFSWPVTMPFYVMRVDTWSPGHLVDTNNYTIRLINSICDFTQFFISSAVQNINAEIHAKTFKEDVALSFGMTAVIVVDIDSKFQRVFEDMCKVLKINPWTIALGNHREISVQTYHQFLNKTKTIVGHDIGTHLSIFQTSKTSQYAWKIVPKDNIDVSQILTAVGR